MTFVYGTCDKRGMWHSLKSEIWISGCDINILGIVERSDNPIFWTPRLWQTGTLRLSTFWTRLFPTPYFSSFAQIVIKSGFHEIGSTQVIQILRVWRIWLLSKSLVPQNDQKWVMRLEELTRFIKPWKLTNSDIDKNGPPIITFVFTVLCNIELFENG